MTREVGKRFLVSGIVQGVFFRASARAQALQLGLDGYARNLPDGSVEVVACGDADALAVFERWLQHGPPSAKVSAVIASAGDFEAPAGFRVC